MFDFSKNLGDLVKCSRETMKLSQVDLSNALGVDSRTILNMENYRGNPKLCILYPLVRFLKIDAQELFYPEMKRETQSIRMLRLLVEDCSEEEAAALIPIFQAGLNILRTKDETK